MIEGSQPENRHGSHFLLFTIIASATILTVSTLSFMNVVELGQLAKEDNNSYKENVIDQSSSLSRVIFAAHRVLTCVPIEGELPEQFIERRIRVSEGLLSHSDFIRKIDREFIDQILAEDPLMLGERSEMSNRDYEIALAQMRETLGLAKQATKATEKTRLLDTVETQSKSFMSLLESRSMFLVQMGDYIFTVSRQRTAHILGHSSRLILSFSVLLLVVAFSFGLYLRSLLRTQSELSLHRSHLRELVERKTAELTSSNSQLRAEIIEREKAETKLRILVSEKETLLKEVYHRVKNNLNMVNSLITLQKNEIPPEARPLFADLESRIAAIALIHEKLYRSADLTGIGLEEYMTDLARGLLFSLSGKPESIRLEIDAPEIQLPADILIPLGLIAAEVITNSIKHGFRFQNGDAITIRATKGTGISIVIGDNGTPPKDADTILKSHSLGALLIQSLCEQLGGSMELSIDGGTIYSFNFPSIQV